MSGAGPGAPVQPCPLHQRPPVRIVIQEKPRAVVHVTPEGSPHEPITLHADATPPGGSISWAAADPAVVRVIGSGATASIAGLSPGTTNVTATYTYLGETASDRTEILAYRVVIEHPSGDPVAAGAATNEFTFSAANPGVLTIECRARVEPAAAQALAEPLIRWRIDDVGNSARTWAPVDPADATRGTGLRATATFNGLPRRHDDFGPKTVTLTLEGCGCRVTTPIEVFYPKNATNHPPDGIVHPGGTPPNWYHYWRQVVGEGHMQHTRYGGAGTGNFGETPGMLNWGYGAAQNKRRIIFFDIASRRDGAIAGLHGPLTGIDLFYNTFRHEREHVRQIARADAVVGVRAGTCWRHGWSFNQANHNHWRLGPGRVAGAGGICEPAGPGTLGAAGSGDVLLNDAAVRDWPTAWGAVPAGAAPAGRFIGGHPIEQQAFQQETSREHALAQYDWGDPGKNHRTRNRWND